MAPKYKDDIRIIRPGAIPAIELLTGKVLKHAYKPHAHEQYAIGVVEAGVQSYQEPGGRTRSHQGPCLPLTREMYTPVRREPKQGINIDSPICRKNLCTATWSLKQTPLPAIPTSSNASPRDPALAPRLFHLFRSLNDPATCRVKAESELVVLLRTLFLRHGELTEGKCSHASTATCKVTEMIRERVAEPVTLTEMAELAGLSRYHFIRVFKKATGLSPHAYLSQARVFHAKAALASGFSDQSHSHMTRSFKAIYGITPGKVNKT